MKKKEVQKNTVNPSQITGQKFEKLRKELTQARGAQVVSVRNKNNIPKPKDKGNVKKSRLWRRK